MFWPCIFATAQVKAKPLSLSLVPGLCTLAWCHQSSSSTFWKGIWTSLHCTLSYTCPIVATYLEWGIISQRIKVLPRWATWDEMRDPKHHLIELLVLLKHCVPAICPKNVLSSKYEVIAQTWGLPYLVISCQQIHERKNKKDVFLLLHLPIQDPSHRIHVCYIW